jgi:outer membrane receptor protein involved in Fe transport
VAHLRPHGRGAVPLQRRHHGVRELEQGLQAGRLDHASVGADPDSPQAARFSPEYSKTYELGLKSQWLDHRLQVNAAVYFTNYDGIQLNIQQGISPVYTNAGNADIKGAELDLQSNVGGGLSLNLSGSYIDAYYTSLTRTPTFRSTSCRTARRYVQRPRLTLHWSASLPPARSRRHTAGCQAAEDTKVEVHVRSDL